MHTHTDCREGHDKHDTTWQFPAHAQDKLYLSNNGLAAHLLRDGPNAHNKLLYASWPSSGLEELLRQWPTIREAAGTAELHVYGGFDWWWATPLYQNEPWFIEWRAVMETLLQQEGVKYWGGVGHETMAEAYAQTGFYAYPTDTPETAPINLMKAQVCVCGGLHVWGGGRERRVGRDA